MSNRWDGEEEGSPDDISVVVVVVVGLFVSSVCFCFCCVVPWFLAFCSYISAFVKAQGGVLNGGWQ